MKKLLITAFIFLLTACGEQSGTSVDNSGGGTTTTGGTTGTATGTPTIELGAISYLDSAGAASTESQIRHSDTDDSLIVTGAIQATVRDADGNTVDGVEVIFTTTQGSIISFTFPTTGTAITASGGLATATFESVDSTASSGVILTATATVDGTTITDTAAFSVAASDSGSSGTSTDAVVRIGTGSGPTGFSNGDITLGLTTIDFGNSTSVSVNVVDARDVSPADGASDFSLITTEDFAVTFTSVCVAAGEATFSSDSVTTSGGTATTTYNATSCSGSDTIAASVTSNGTTVQATGTITINADTPSLIVTEGTPNPASLGIQGTPTLEDVTEVTFSVTGTTDLPVEGTQVSFTTSTSAGGIDILSPADDGFGNHIGTTDANGQITARVQSGSVRTDFTVLATLVSPTAGASADNTTAESSSISINTGVGDQNSFSIAASNLRPEADDFIGVESTITVQLGEISGNNVAPDGTEISFITEAGIIGSSCTLSNGSCSVAWRSGEDAADGIARTTILASTIGAESFNDADQDGRFGAGDTILTDLGEPFLDANEDGVYTAGEQFNDTDLSTSHNTANGLYDGPLCDSTCGSSSINIFKEIVLIIGDSNANIDINGGAQINVDANDATSFVVEVVGVNGELMPTGTTVTATIDNIGASNLALAGTTTHTLADGVGAVGDSSFFTFTVTANADSTGSGTVNINVTTPGGTLTSMSESVVIGGVSTGDVSDAADVALALSATNITRGGTGVSATATVTSQAPFVLADLENIPVEFVVVNALDNSQILTDVLTLDPSNGIALTDNTGVATINISADETGDTGPVTVLARAYIPDDNSQEAVTAPLTIDPASGVVVTAASLDLSVIYDSTGTAFGSIDETDGAVATATVIGTDGFTPEPFALVTFTTTNGLAELSTTTGLTDIAGQTSVNLDPAFTSGADIITASASVGGTDVTDSVGYAVSITGGTIVTTVSGTVETGSPATVTATLLEPDGDPIVNETVTFSLGASLGILGTTTALTDSNGQATAQIFANTTSGVDTVTASATVGGTPKNDVANYQVQATTSTSGSIDLAIAYASGTSITAADNATITATVRDGSGAVVDDVIVTFTTDAAFGVLSPGTALTAGGGLASATLSSGTTSGAATVSATATVGGEAIAGTVNYVADLSAGASVGTLSIGLSATSVDETTTSTVTATLLDDLGAGIVGEVITFNTGLGTLSPTTALTGAGGIATVTLSAGDTSGADAVTATASISGVDLEASTNYQVALAGGTSAGTVSVAVNYSAGTDINELNPATVEATVQDSGGAPITNAVVTFTTTNSLGVLSQTTALTNGTGVATVNLGAGTVSGADTVTATVTVNTQDISGSAAYAVNLTGVSIVGTIAANVAYAGALTSINEANAGTVTATVLESDGSTPVVGAVVSFTASLGNLSPATAQTNASGVATVSLGAGTSSGAGTVTTSVTIDGETITDTDNYTVLLTGTGTDGTVTVTAGATTLDDATTSTTITATVLEADGSTPVTNELVTFSTSLGSFSPALGTALTDGSGVATITLLAGDVNGADSVVATANISGVDVSGSVNYVVNRSAADVGAIGLTLVYANGTDINELNDLTVTANVDDSLGANLPGAVVTFTTSNGLGVLSQTSALTDASGDAAITISAGTASGADTITATVTFDGQDVSASEAYQVNLTGVSVVGTIAANVAYAGALTSINEANAGTVTATVLEADGSTPVVGAVVSFTASLGNLNPATAQTNASGVATVSLEAGTASGAGTVTTSVTIDGETITDTDNYTVLLTGTGTDGTVTVTAGATTLDDATTSTTITATVLEADGSTPVTNELVTFSTSLGSFSPALGTALTDGSGVATITLLAGDENGADSVVATANISGVDVSGSVNYVVNRAAADVGAIGLTLVYANGTDINELNDLTVTANVDDSLGANLPGAVVTFTTSNGLGVLSQTSALTDASGDAAITISAGTASGADTITATVTFDGQDVSASEAYQVNLTGVSVVGTITANVAYAGALTSINEANAGTVTATVLEADGSTPVVGAVVSFTASLGNLNPATAQTNASGVATVSLEAGTTSGAGTVTTSVTIDGETITDTDNYTVLLTGTGTDGTVTVTAGATTLDDATTSTTITATVLEADGSTPVTNELVTFSTSLGSFSPALGTALTDGSGVATITLLAGDENGADSVVATTNISGVEVSGSVNYVVNRAAADVGAIGLTLVYANGTDINEVDSLTVTANVDDSLGANLPGAVVTFTTSNGLGVLSQTSALTDASGDAAITISAGTASGADTITATVTFDGQDVSASQAYQVNLTGASPDGIMTVAIAYAVGSTITESNTATATITLTESDGTTPITNTVVTLTTGVATLSQTSVLTDGSGQATVTLSAGATSGADALTATAQVNGNDVSGSSNYQVALAGVSDGSMTVVVAYSSGTAISENNPATITATLLDGSSNPVDDAVIQFSAPIGTLVPSSAITGATVSGQASVQLLAGADEGASTITATTTLNGTVITADAVFVVDLTGASTVGNVAVTVTPTAGTEVNEGVDATVTARVTQPDGTTPIVGQLVTFTTTLGNLDVATAITDGSGDATVTLSAGATSGADVVTATANISGEDVVGTGNYVVNLNGNGLDGIVTVAITYASGSAIDETNNATALITVTDRFGTAQPGVIVNLATTLGTLSQASGVTDGSGQLSVTITENGTSGGDVITATTNITGNDITGSANYAVSLTGATALGSISVAVTYTSGSTIVSGAPATATATLLDDSMNPIVGRPVSFSVALPGGAATDIVSLSPSTATVLTDASGNASIELTSTGTGDGTAFVSAEGFITDADTVSGNALFVVGEDTSTVGNFQLGNGSGGGFTQGVLALSLDPISFGGSTSVTATVVDADSANALVSDLIDVTFTSVCTLSGDSSIDASVTTIGGTATAQYTATTCTGADVITASATLNGTTATATVTLNINADTAGQIQFVSASPTTIATSGTSGTSLQETSSVTFRVLGSTGEVLANELVNFSLSTNVGGITLSSASATSDSSGEVTVTVTSGTVPTSVVVRAELNSDPTIATESSSLAISTGLADQDSFTVTPAILNPEAADVVGTTVVFTARLADASNNPVPDGTIVSFRTEGGSIEPNCSTTNGACTVTWTSQLPLPTDHRATVLAYAIGVESFTDSDGDNAYDNGETFQDLAEAFSDDNENGGRDSDEFFVDFNTNTTFDAADTFYNGVQCDTVVAVGGAAAGDCVDTPRTVNVRQSNVLVMAGSTADVTITGAGLAPAANTFETISVQVEDSQNQVMPEGTTITATVDGDDFSIVGPTSFTVGSTNSTLAADRTYSFVVQTDPAAISGSAGIIFIDVTTPGGTTTNASATITVP